MRPAEIHLARFPFGDVPGMKLHPVLLLTGPLGSVPEVLLFKPGAIPWICGSIHTDHRREHAERSPPVIAPAGFVLLPKRSRHDIEQQTISDEEITMIITKKALRQALFAILVDRFFATDRKSKPKGMVEVIL